MRHIGNKVTDFVPAASPVLRTEVEELPYGFGPLIKDYLDVNGDGEADYVRTSTFDSRGPLPANYRALEGSPEMGTSFDDANGDGLIDFVYRQRPSGEFEGWFDGNFDAVSDIHAVFQPDGTAPYLTGVEQLDTDWDGVFDTEVTRTVRTPEDPWGQTTRAIHIDAAEIEER